MNQAFVSYVRLNSLLGDKIYINNEIGTLKLPRLCDLNGQFLLYNSQLITFVELYNDNKNNFLEKLIESDAILSFINFMMYFITYDEITYDNQKIIYTINIDNTNITRFIDKTNINIVMDTLKIMHYM